MHSKGKNIGNYAPRDAWLNILKKGKNMIIKNMKKIIAVIMLLFGTQAHAGSFLTSVQHPYEIGSIFNLDIIGTGFTTNVDGGGVNLSFDQTVLNVLSVNIDESVWNIGSAGIIDNAAGMVDRIIVDTSTTVSGDFVVATIEFEAIGLGNSWLRLTELATNPWTSGGNLISPEFIDTTVAVTAVPVPAAVWLFGSGLLGLFGFAKRKTIRI